MTGSDRHRVRGSGQIRLPPRAPAPASGPMARQCHQRHVPLWALAAPLAPEKLSLRTNIGEPRSVSRTVEPILPPTDRLFHIQLEHTSPAPDCQQGSCRRRPPFVMRSSARVLLDQRSLERLLALRRRFNRTRYTPWRRADPASSTPFQTTDCGPAGRASSTSVRTRRPDRSYTRTRARPARASSKRTVAEGLNGFGCTPVRRVSAGRSPAPL